LRSTLVVAHDHEIIRNALASLLQKREDLVVIGQAGNGREALEAALGLEPDVLIADLQMRELSGVEVSRRLRDARSRTRTLLLAMDERVARLEEALRAGASGCLAGDSTADELFAAIDAVRRGDSYLSPSMARRVLNAFACPSDSESTRLTSREREVLLRIAEGYSTKEIADQLGVSPRTAEGYRASLTGKLGVHRIAELVRLAIREGLLPL
jgi:DNA-binding NarL/FixJ family response regulator